MDFVVLGCGSAFPSPKRGASAYVLRLPNGECWMFDCGEGTQIELMRSEIKAGRIRRIFITHMHGDHVFGLPGLMCTMGQLGSASSDTDGDASESSVDIYGPRGLRRFVREALRLSRSVLAYRYRVHELQFDDAEFQTTSPFTGDHDQLMPVKWDSDLESPLPPPHPNEELGLDIQPSPAGLWLLPLPSSSPAVSAAWLPHTAPSFAFLVREADRPGKLDVVRAKALGVPNGPLLGRLKSGGEVTTPDGRTVTAGEVVGPPVPGRRVLILGDTNESSGAVRALCGAGEGRLDLLVHEATLGEQMRESARMKGHSTPEQAAAAAKAGRAECLLLTHFSQRYSDEDIEELKEEAARDFKGRIELARPMMKLRV